MIKKPYSHRRPSGGYWKMYITVYYFVMKKKKGQIVIATELLSTVNPLISPPGAYLFQAHLSGAGGLI